MQLFSFKKKRSSQSAGSAPVVDVIATPVRNQPDRAASPASTSTPGSRSSKPASGRNTALPPAAVVSTEIAPFFARLMPVERLQLSPALRVFPFAVYLLAFAAVAGLGVLNWKSHDTKKRKDRIVSETATIRQEAGELQTQLEATNTRFGLASQLIVWADHTAAVQPILVACAEAFTERVQVNALSIEQKDHNALKLTLSYQALGDPEKFAPLQDDLLKRLAAIGWMLDGEPTENGPQINYSGTLTRVSH